MGLVPPRPCPCSLGPQQPPGRLSPAFTPLPVVARDPPWSPHFLARRGPGVTLFPAATQRQERATPTPPTAVREHPLRVGTAQHTAVTGRQADENPALTSGGRPRPNKAGCVWSHTVTSSRVVTAHREGSKLSLSRSRQGLFRALPARGLCGDHSTLPLHLQSSHRQYISKQM